MKKIIFVILALTFLTTQAQAFEVGDVKGRIALNLMRTSDEPSNRINVLPHIEYKNVFFSGDYNMDFRDSDTTLQRTQQKTLVGAELYKDISARYQYENYDSITTTVNQKIVNSQIVNITKVKEIQYQDNRIGLGYKAKTNLYNTDLSFDAMILHEEIYDYRTEASVTLDNKYIRLRNQVYFDFNGFNQQKYYDRIILSYKITPNFYITSQLNWVTDKAPTKRLGISFIF